MNKNNRGNRDRNSRFGPRDNYGGPPASMMPIQYPSRQAQGNAQKPLTEEQLAFEMEFTKWEKSFVDWQKAYANHPDRVAYKQYEQKFLDVRDKLLIKRAQIYSKNTMEHQLASELGAAAAMADSILQKFGDPSTPSTALNFNNPRGYDRYNRPPPMMNNRYDDNRRGGGRQDRSRSPYFNRDPPGYSGGRQQFSRSPPRHQGRQNDRRQNNDQWSNQRGMQQRGGDRGGRGDRGEGRNRNDEQESAKKIKRREFYNMKELERKDAYPLTPW